jgi:arsenate reductase (glutaredoxin)
MITIYHKSSCSTSIKVLNILKASGKKYKVIEYINTPPNAEELKVVLEKLGISAEALIRKKEPLFKEKYGHKKLNEKLCIQIMVDNPNLIERPILIKRTRAIIGRPIEAAEKFIFS